MKKLVLAGLLVLVIAPRVWSQESVERFERNLQQIQRDTQERFDAELPQTQRALVDYGGYLTLGYLSFDDAAHDNHGLRQYELVGYGHLNLDGVHEFYTRGRAEYDNYNSGDSFEHLPDRLMGRMEEGWYRFDLQRYFSAYQNRTIDYDLAIKGGRQFMSWGNGLTLDQYADGILGQFRNKNIEIDALGCVTVKETIDFDVTRPDFDHNTHRGYFGAKVSVPVGPHHPYAYFLYQRDFNRPESDTTHVIFTRYRYDSYYAGVGSNGAVGDHLAYGGEFCYEGGNGLSSSVNPVTQNPQTQSDDTIQAYAANLKLDYLLSDRRRTKFTVEGLLASGDKDRSVTAGTFGGNAPHTRDTAFNGLGVIYDGLAFTPAVSNLMMLRVGASTYPLPDGALRGLQTGADFFVFGKARIEAPIDETTNDKRYLGCESDLFVNWQITDDVSLAVRYGLFFPGEAIPSGDQDHYRQFIYAAVTYAF